MTDDELIARADANYFESMRMLAPALAGGEARERGGLLIAATGLPVPFLNIAFVTRPLSEAEALMQAAIAYFDGRGLPFVVRVREGLDPASERAAELCGLRYGDAVPGMVLSPLHKAEVAAGALEVRRVEEPATLRVYGDALAAGFDMPLEVGRQFVSETLLAIPDSHLYLGYLDGQAVATSALVMSHWVAGVYNVATLAPFRRRGIGEAMTRHAVDQGMAAGCVMSSLQSSEMGYPVYERMGFRRVTGYRTYARPEG